MKFNNTLAVIISNTIIATIKLNSLRASKNYLVQATNTIVRNQYRPYTVQPAFMSSVSNILPGKGVIKIYNSTQFAFIAVQGAI